MWIYWEEFLIFLMLTIQKKCYVQYRKFRNNFTNFRYRFLIFEIFHLKIYVLQNVDSNISYEDNTRFVRYSVTKYVHPSTISCIPLFPISSWSAISSLKNSDLVLRNNDPGNFFSIAFLPTVNKWILINHLQ